MPLFGSQVPNHEIFVLKFAPHWPRILFDTNRWPPYEVLAALGRLANMKSRSTRSQGITGWQILRDGNQPLQPGSEQHSFSAPHGKWLFRLVEFREKSWLKMMVLIGNVGCIDGVSCIMLHSMTHDGWRWGRCFFWTGIVAARSKRNN